MSTFAISIHREKANSHIDRIDKDGNKQTEIKYVSSEVAGSELSANRAVNQSVRPTNPEASSLRQVTKTNFIVSK
jgi:hypothetical protein